MSAAFLIMAILISAGAAAPHPASGAQPVLTRLNGAPLGATDGPTTLLFWRADCAPCLLELSDLAALREAAAPSTLIPVGLQPVERLKPALRRLKLRDADTAKTDEDPASLLTRLGGGLARLPLAVAFRADGSVCATHQGLIGRDRVSRWSAECGVGHAAR